MSKRLQALLLEQTECIWCGVQSGRAYTKWSVEHILPKSRGGSSHACNTALACVDCNSARKSQTVVAFYQRQHQMQLQWPAALFDGLDRLQQHGSKKEQQYAAKQKQQLQTWLDQRIKWGFR